MERINKIFKHELFVENLSKIKKYEKDRIFCRHGIEHLLDVARIGCIYLAEYKLQNGHVLSDIIDEYIYAAALLHDLGRAEQYEKGIRASMQFYGISESVISEYLHSSVVAYGGQLEQILNQKYIAFFNNSGWEPFYNIRSTGIPVLNIGDNMNNPSGKIPVRWRYPQTEYQTNEANVQEAIKRQFDGTDGVDNLMWLLQ